MSAPTEIAAFLRDVVLFREFSDADRLALARRLGERRLRKGQVLFREGDAGAEMFLVRRGRALVSKAVVGRVEQVLARLGRGECFGEMSLLDRSPRSATIQAEEDTDLLVLDAENLAQLIDLDPRAAAAFFRALVHVFIARLRESGQQLAEVTRWGLEATGMDVESR